MGGRAPPSPSFRIFRMEEHRKQRPQNAVNAHERRIPRAQHPHNSERKLKEERAAKLRVERELQDWDPALSQLARQCCDLGQFW